MKRLNHYLFVFLLLSFQGIASPLPSDEAPILHPSGLLWKIEKAGRPDSYLFGTMHLSDPRVTRLKPEVEQAFNQSGQFVSEMIMNFEAIGYVSQASFFNNGQTLDALMGERAFQRMSQLIRERKRPLNADMLRHMKPWAVMIMLMLPAEESASGVALDMMLYTRAHRQNKQLKGLETPQEQVAVFETLNLQEQVWMLMQTLDEVETIERLMGNMISLYLQEDLQALMQMQLAYMDESTDIDDRFMYQLLDVRNQRMAQRLEPILAKGNAFIAIGALHLPGKNGVLHLLEQAGYRVSRVETSVIP